MLKVFIILLFYQGDILVMERNLPTYSLCEKRRAAIESEMVEAAPVFAGKLKCVQSEINPNQGQENAIYHQASTANQ